jgi:hypothetical protein
MCKKITLTSRAAETNGGAGNGISGCAKNWGRYLLAGTLALASAGAADIGQYRKSPEPDRNPAAAQSSVHGFTPEEIKKYGLFFRPKYLQPIALRPGEIMGVLTSNYSTLVIHMPRAALDAKMEYSMTIGTAAVNGATTAISIVEFPNPKESTPDMFHARNLAPNALGALNKALSGKTDRWLAVQILSLRKSWVTRCPEMNISSYDLGTILNPAQDYSATLKHAGETAYLVGALYRKIGEGRFRASSFSNLAVHEAMMGSVAKFMKENGKGDWERSNSDTNEGFGVLGEIAFGDPQYGLLRLVSISGVKPILFPAALQNNPKVMEYTRQEMERNGSYRILLKLMKNTGVTWIPQLADLPEAKIREAALKALNAHATGSFGVTLDRIVDTGTVNEIRRQADEFYNKNKMK